MSLQLVANIVVLAAIYALVSTGYVLIYRVSRVLNLAHGELMMIGAYLLVATAGAFSGNPLLALLLAAAGGLVMGMVVYAVLMRWLTGEAVLAAVLITIALGILLRGLRMRAAGQNPLLAEQRGIRLHGIYAFAWGLSTFTASLAGMLLSLDSGVESTMATIGLKAFPAALVGGLDSLL